MFIFYGKTISLHLSYRKSIIKKLPGLNNGSFTQNITNFYTEIILNVLMDKF